MVENATPEQLKEAQRQVKAVISDQKTFNEAFELSFKHYDKNGDGHIEMREYGEFMDDFLTSIHKKKGSFSTVIKNWKKADKNSDGKISKEEFKEEVFNKMKEFTEQQF
jgi:Ca2+-binding EF-hand superfamily protein